MGIEIYFRGLICHHGASFSRSTPRSRKIKSTMVRDGLHKPHISINGARDEVTTHIEFSRRGEARVLAAFNHHVPHLEDLTRMTVDLQPGATHEVMLPDGDLTVADYFEYGAIFSLDGVDTTLKCVARTTILIADSPTLSVTYNQKTINLTNNDWVFIENASLDVPNPAGRHWKNHVRVLRAAPDDLASYKRGPARQDCDAATPGGHLPDLDALSKDQKGIILAATSSECTNSQWP
jgi:hypothetical protein